MRSWAICVMVILFVATAAYWATERARGARLAAEAAELVALARYEVKSGERELMRMAESVDPKMACAERMYLGWVTFDRENFVPCWALEPGRTGGVLVVRMGDGKEWGR